MTSVPKPLKFLRSHYPGMKAIYQRMSAGDNRQALADVLSVLAMNAGAEGARECLNFRLAGSSETAGSWGHEYVRCAELPRYCRLRANLASALVWTPVHLGCCQCVTLQAHLCRHVAGEIGLEWQERLDAEKSTEDLLALVHQIVPFHMAHNAEPEAVDLLLEVPRCSNSPCHLHLHYDR